MKYSRIQKIQAQLLGKVKFTDDECDEDKLHLGLAKDLIAEAEAEVELDLSPRYASPFRDTDKGTWEALPETTRAVLRTLSELKSCLRILETEFGRGTVTDGAKYMRKIEDRYTLIRDKLLLKREGSYNTWAYPPLPGLAVNYMNIADTGFGGEIHHHSRMREAGSYPAEVMNDPSQNYANADIEPSDEEPNT